MRKSVSVKQEAEPLAEQLDKMRKKFKKEHRRRKETEARLEKGNPFEPLIAKMEPNKLYVRNSVTTTNLNGFLPRQEPDSEYARLKSRYLLKSPVNQA